MINIIIFSLFMCILNIEAAGACKKTVCLTGEEAARNYRFFQYNIELYGISDDNSLVLRVCHALSKPDFFQNENPVLQTDIDIILYTLRQASECNARALVDTFFSADCQVNLGLTIPQALGRCVPPVNPNALEEILDFFPHVRDHDDLVQDIKDRYKQKESKRFSLSLKYAVWKIALVDKGSPAHLAWLTRKSAKIHYETLQSNLAKEHVKVERSIMLQVCGALTKPDIYQKTDIWLQTDIEIVLYLLCQESETHAAKLAETFSKEEDKVRKRKSILYAFARCVPDVRSNDIRAILDCLPLNVCGRARIIVNNINRYKRKLARRFSASMQDFLWQWEVHPESDGQPLQLLQQCPSHMKSDVMSPKFDYPDPKFAYEGSHQDTGAVSSVSCEYRSWFKVKPTQENYKILEDNLANDDITVANSLMLYICRELSKLDCEQDTPCLLKTDIKTILYILCQESARNTYPLADTFREEETKVRKNHKKLSNNPKEVLYALGRSVPKMKPQDVQYVLSTFPPQDVIDAWSEFPDEKNRYKIVKNIMKRYLEKKDAERFHPLLEGIAVVVKSYEEIEEFHPETYDFSPMKISVLPPKCYPNPQPFRQPQQSMNCLVVPHRHPPMQNVMSPEYYPNPQPFRQPQQSMNCLVVPHRHPPMQNVRSPEYYSNPQPFRQPQQSMNCLVVPHRHPPMQNVMSPEYYPNPQPPQPQQSMNCLVVPHRHPLMQNVMSPACAP